MASESSTTAECTDTMESTSCKDGLSWNNINSHFRPRIALEPFFAFDNYGHTGLNPLLDIIRRCVSFCKIITGKPALFLPKQIAAFFLFWYEPNEKDLSSITILLSVDTVNEPKLNLLQSVVKAFDLEDAGDASLSISLTNFEAECKEMTLPSDDKKDATYNLKGFFRICLKPIYRLLFDDELKVFLS